MFHSGLNFFEKNLYFSGYATALNMNDHIGFGKSTNHFVLRLIPLKNFTVANFVYYLRPVNEAIFLFNFQMVNN